MFRKILASLCLMLALCFLFGCSNPYREDTQPTAQPPQTDTSAEVSTNSTTIPVTAAPTEAATIPVTVAPTDPAVEEPTAQVTEPVTPDGYTVKISYYKLAIHTGPGYSFPVIDHITDQGTYTIVDESTERLGNGVTTTWGKLKSGAGWINLDDAANPTSDPVMCEDCQKSAQEVPVSRYGYCDDCHAKNGVADYGKCEVCGDSINGVAVNLFNGKRCFSCHICDECGEKITEDEFFFYGAYICSSCYYYSQVPEVFCIVCGIDCSFSGTTNGMCDDCYYIDQLPPQVCDVCGITFKVDTIPTNGECPDCRNSSVTYYTCRFCGNSCEPWDTDDVCIDCEGTPCSDCGGPLNASHDCDDYPNAFCPDCGWGMFTTGIGIEGLHCPDCDKFFFP